jgi:ComF family protein
MHGNLRKIPNWINTFLQLIYPPVCISCKKIISLPSNLAVVCSKCLSSFAPVPPQFIQDQILNRIEGSFLDELFVCVCFDDTIKNIIHHIKYEKKNHLAFEIGKYCRQFLSKSFENMSIDLAIPVPLHPLREKERGYNQSWHIGRGLLFSMPFKMTKGLMKRKRYTESQTNLNRIERQKNLEDAFELAEDITIKGKSILLLDDVVTTGTTLNVCAKVLKKSGVSRISAVTLSTPIGEKYFYL